MKTIDHRPWQTIAGAIHDTTGHRLTAHTVTPIGGGCINQTYLLADPAQRYFVKVNESDRADMFAAEAAALAELLSAQTVKVPMPICHGTTESYSYNVMEFMKLSRAGAKSAGELGRQLAKLHQRTCNFFGWVRDNTIGTTPQKNPKSDNWVDFWREHRLGYQLNLAKRNGCEANLLTQGNQLSTRLEGLFSGYTAQASLLHGDLWSGNYAEADGAPVIFDPASYYGDREADLAMTELFGGFPKSFYEAYQETFPLHPGYAIRKDLYNLYHVLNHFNLFGPSYLPQAYQLINRLLSTLS